MKYKQIFLENLQRTSLKRVRIKVDPAAVNVSEDLSKCDGYEGYVLAEDAAMVRVLIVIPDTDEGTEVMNIPIEYLEPVQQDSVYDKLEHLKSFIISAINVANDDPIIKQIHSCRNIDDIESFLKDRGLTSEDITKLYKYYSML